MKRAQNVTNRASKEAKSGGLRCPRGNIAEEALKKGRFFYPPKDAGKTGERKQRFNKRGDKYRKA